MNAITVFTVVLDSYSGGSFAKVKLGVGFGKGQILLSTDGFYFLIS